MTACNLIVAGVGGQGILTMAEIIARAAVAAGHDVKQTEFRGMAQRGGSVVSHIRFGENVHSPLCAKSDVDYLFGLELIETVRHLKEIQPRQGLIYNTQCHYAPGTNNPTGFDAAHCEEHIHQHLDCCYALDGAVTTKELGDIRLLNCLMLGAASTLLPLPEHLIEAMLIDKIPTAKAALAFAYGADIMHQQLLSQPHLTAQAEL